MSKVSFTIRRPAPPPRSIIRHSSEEIIDSNVAIIDSSDEEEEPQGPLVIPALQNRDWREMARKRRAGLSYVPPSGQAGIGKDGSVGGLGTRDTINSGVQLEGLQAPRKRPKTELDENDAGFKDYLLQEGVAGAKDAAEVKEEETDEERAIRAVLASARGETREGGPHIDIIPAGGNEWGRRPTEDDAFKQDVDALPDEATLDDYERVPVEQFGAALLRGMGWKEGTAASKKKKGPVEPWLPQARPALLGIGAKEREALDDGSMRKAKGRPDKRYVPVIRQGRDDGRASSSRSQPPSGTNSHRSSRSQSPSRRNRKESDYEQDRDRPGDRKRERERDRGSGGSERRGEQHERDVYQKDQRRNGRHEEYRGDRDKHRERSRRN